MPHWRGSTCIALTRLSPQVCDEVEAPIPPGVAYSLNYTDTCGLAQALAGSPAAAALSPAPPAPGRHLLAGAHGSACAKCQILLPHADYTHTLSLGDGRRLARRRAVAGGRVRRRGRHALRRARGGGRPPRVGFAQVHDAGSRSCVVVMSLPLDIKGCKSAVGVSLNMPTKQPPAYSWLRYHADGAQLIADQLRALQSGAQQSTSNWRGSAPPGQCP